MNWWIILYIIGYIIGYIGSYYCVRKSIKDLKATFKSDYNWVDVTVALSISLILGGYLWVLFDWLGDIKVPKSKPPKWL